ncbi:MAG TPA: MaoC family dehydratase [Acidimicrobiia bacterium]|jgi:acyl dehydratase
MGRAVTKDELAGLAGTDLGHSDWLAIDQGMIDRFADVTGDHQYIHVDPARAALTPFGSTIAHGFLTTSLLVPLIDDIGLDVEGAVMGVNYGFDKLRFIAPVKVGKRIRLAATVKNVAERDPGRVVVTYGCTIEIEGEDRPALAADWLTMIVTA